MTTYICIEAAQENFILIHGETIKTRGNLMFNILDGAVRLSIVPKAVGATLNLPFHFITGIYIVSRRSCNAMRIIKVKMTPDTH